MSPDALAAAALVAAALIVLAAYYLTAPWCRRGRWALANVEVCGAEEVGPNYAVVRRGWIRRRGLFSEARFALEGADPCRFALLHDMLLVECEKPARVVA